MKKFLLSFGLIVVFAFYALLSSTRNATNQIASLSTTPTTDTITPPIVPSTAQVRTPAKATTKPVSAAKPAAATITTRTVYVRNGDDEEDGGYYTTITTPIPIVATNPTPTPIPTPVPKPTPVVTTPAPTPVVTTNTGKFKNGTFTGPIVDAYYGNVQVSVVTTGGKLTDVQFLQYPSDRSTSVRINTRAMPILKSEAISAQSAPVNGVSGASETSRAFNTSLASALALAAN